MYPWSTEPHGHFDEIIFESERLKDNPNDIEGLFDRGELSLEEGSLDPAVQDFRRVMKNNPPADLLKKAKEKLYYALTEDFQHNFDQAEKYADDYAALCALVDDYLARSEHLNAIPMARSPLDSYLAHLP